jgi:hypothetical protein
MKPTIEIGDKVKIVNSGKIYSSYNFMFKKLGFKNIVQNDCPDNFANLIFKVMGKAKHEDEEITLYFIKSNEVELLISKKGIEVIEETLPIKKSILVVLAGNNSFCESIIKKEFPQLFEQPKELTISEIEQILGYKILIKE